jgi:hypothetical protein
MSSFNDLIYPTALALLFLTDSAFFSFGYAVQTDLLKNKVKSVEPTYFGWLVAIICYPPFNDLVSKYFTWYANDMARYPSVYQTFVLRAEVLVLFAIFVWATVALGAKCSNLTNRGIVSHGPYRYIRHPAYSSKCIGWWLTILPVMSIPAFITMSVWSLIYYARAITEERHLMRDPDYQEYCKKVRYRFIPYIY